MRFILYVIDGCPFCKKVLEFASENDIHLDIRSITGNDEHLQELIEKGGKRQAPFLIDTQDDVSLYESDAIIAHMRQKTPRN